MSSQNRLFEDLARVAGGAASTLAGIRQEVEALARQQVERLLGELDLVTREEFDAVRAMAAKARAEQEALEKRVAALEEQLRKKGTAGTGTAKASTQRRRRATGAKTPAGKKTAPKG